MRPIRWPGSTSGTLIEPSAISSDLRGTVIEVSDLQHKWLCWGIDAKIFTDLLGQHVTDLGVPWNRRPFFESGIVPPRMTAAFANLLAALGVEMLEQLFSLHSPILTSE
jgi:hypothetical protein